MEVSMAGVEASLVARVAATRVDGRCYFAGLCASCPCVWLKMRMSSLAGVLGYASLSHAELPYLNLTRPHYIPDP